MNMMIDSEKIYIHSPMLIEKELANAEKKKVALAEAKKKAKEDDDKKAKEAVEKKKASENEKSKADKKNGMEGQFSIFDMIGG